MVTHHRRICEPLYRRPPTLVLGERPPHRYRWQRRPGNDCDDDDPIIPVTRVRHTLHVIGEEDRKSHQRPTSRNYCAIQRGTRMYGVAVGQRRPICSAAHDDSYRAIASMAFCEGRQETIEKPTVTSGLLNRSLSGERGIRTPGTSRYGSFQDCCNRPLYHLSKKMVTQQGIEPWTHRLRVCCSTS